MKHFKIFTTTTVFLTALAFHSIALATPSSPNSQLTCAAIESSQLIKLFNQGIQLIWVDDAHFKANSNLWNQVVFSRLDNKVYRPEGQEFLKYMGFYLDRLGRKHSQIIYVSPNSMVVRLPYFTGDNIIWTIFTCR